MPPYSTEAFLEMLASYNAAIWPGQLSVFFLNTLLLGILLFPRTGSDRIIAGLLAFSWLWSGLVFMNGYLTHLNWSSRYFGVVFAIQGLLLIWSGIIKNRLHFSGDASAASWLGIALVIFALIIYPLTQIIIGIDWMAVQYAGIAPTPTVIITLGALLLCADWVPIHLLVIPIVWSCVDGVTVWNLGFWWDLSLPLAGLLTIYFSIVRPQHVSKSGD